jgi:hypothetical protein
MRTNTQGPGGSSTWSRVPTFDEAGYNKALADWNAQSSASAGSPPLLFGGEGGGPIAGLAAPRGAAPSKDQFTTNSWTLKNELSPEQQALYDANTHSQIGQANLLGDATSRVGQSLSSPVDWANLPSLSSEKLNPEGIRQDAADSIYSLNTRYLDPQFESQQKGLESRLADQGFSPGTPGYDQAMKDFGSTRNQAYGDARDKAVTGGYAAGQTMFGQNLASQQQGNSVRNQAIAELLQKRLQPLSELNALRSGSQPQNPFAGGAGGSSPTPNLQGVDIAGLLGQNYQNQLGQYSANVASNNQTTGTLAQLAAMAAMFMSDGRLKDILEREGQTSKGIPLYRFRYKGRSEILCGVIAQEAAEICPEAVHRHSSGYLMVDYSKVG